jgi:hypothetical protein
MIKSKYRGVHTNRHLYEITWICDAQGRAAVKNRDELYNAADHLRNPLTGT